MPVYILPISHVAGESRARAVWAVETLRPDVVAVELDGRRLGGLLEAKNRRYFDWRHPKESLIAIVFQAAQRFFGGKTGEVPGEEFLVAIRAASRFGIPVALIDRDIGITLSRLSKAINIGTIFKFLWLLVFGKKTEGFDLDSVPEEKIVVGMLKELKREFPGIYKALVSERDRFMSEQILLIPKEKAILVVVGAAHIPGMRKKLAGATIL
jgi:pheromone shutdown protein TraB